MKDAPTRCGFVPGTLTPRRPGRHVTLGPPAQVHQATASPRAPATAASLSFYQRLPSRHLIPPPPANGFDPPRDRSPAPISSEHNQCAPWPRGLLSVQLPAWKPPEVRVPTANFPGYATLQLVHFVRGCCHHTIAITISLDCPPDLPISGTIFLPILPSPWSPRSLCPKPALYPALTCLSDAPLDFLASSFCLSP